MGGANCKMRHALPASFKMRNTKAKPSDWVWVKKAAATHGVYPPQKQRRFLFQRASKKKRKNTYSGCVKKYLEKVMHLSAVCALMKENVGLELLPLTQRELTMLIDAPNPIAAINAIHIMSDNDHTFDFSTSLEHAKRINNTDVIEVLNERV